MKRKIFVFIFAVMLIGTVSSGAKAATFSLFDYAFNIDGTFTDLFPPPAPGSPVPPEANISSFDTTTGLGSISVMVNGNGSHYVGLFVDHDINRIGNTGFFDEFGDTSVAPPAPGQSWEIDEPGFVFGDIFSNITAGTLDNSNGVPLSSFPLGEDVSMALAWDFLLSPLDKKATVTFNVGEVAPLSGFYLSQEDSLTGEKIFFSSNLDIEPVPEPTTIALLGIGILGLAGAEARRRRKAKSEMVN